MGQSSSAGHRRSALAAAAAVGGLAAGITPASAFAAAPPAPTRAADVSTGSADPGADGAGARVYRTQPVRWEPCAWYSSSLPAPVPECATISVPRNWQNPAAGESLQVAISRTKAAEPARRMGILFTNPGGPGGSGVTLPWALGRAQPAVAARYDIVGMDPRGTGQSTQLVCNVPTEPLTGLVSYDYRDYSAAAVASRQTVLKAVADACAANSLTPYINTWQTVHDMELIRALLDERKLNYVGYSYGTWLGAKYAAVFPRKTGKVVLDSNTAWMGQLSESWELQPKSFQRRWRKQVVPWTTRSPVFNKYVGTTSAQVNATYERVRATYKEYWKDVTVGMRLDESLLQSLYRDAGFIEVAYNLGLLQVCIVENHDWSPETIAACQRRFADQVNADLGGGSSAVASAKSQAAAALRDPQSLDGGRPDPLRSVFAARRSAATETVPVAGVFYAVRCGDGGNWHTPAWWIRFGRQQGRLYPLDGYASAVEVCAYWSAASHRLPKPDPHRLGPIVTVQAEFDPATAYESTIHNVRAFRDARLIAIDDAGGHGQYGIGGNSCVDDLVNAYLLDHRTPGFRTRCEAAPLPLETRVYPAVGPVDRSYPWHPSHRRPVDPRVMKQVDQSIR